MGKHRRSSDGYQPPEFGHAGDQNEVAKFDANVSRHAVAVADKRMYGEYPYDQEPGSKPTIDRATGQRRSS